MTTLHEAALKKYGSPAEVRKAEQANRARLRYRPITPHKDYECVGGPYHGESLKLTTPSTGPICVAGWVGQYVGVNSLSEPRAAYARQVCQAWLEHRYPYAWGSHANSEAPYVFWQEEL